MPVKLKKKTGVLNSEVTVTDHGEVVSDNVASTMITIPAPQMAQEAPMGEVWVSIPMKVSKGFQSIGVEVGARVPWPMPAGDESAIRDGIAFVSKIIEEEVAMKMQSAPMVLNTLIETYKR